MRGTKPTKFAVANENFSSAALGHFNLEKSESGQHTMILKVRIAAWQILPTQIYSSVLINLLQQALQISLGVSLFLVHRLLDICMSEYACSVIMVGYWVRSAVMQGYVV